jgi:hypothetical protein
MDKHLKLNKGFLALLFALEAQHIIQLHADVLDISIKSTAAPTAAETSNDQSSSDVDVNKNAAGDDGGTEEYVRNMGDYITANQEALSFVDKQLVILKHAYHIDSTDAFHQIVAECSRKYAAQLVDQAFRAAKNFQERRCARLLTLVYIYSRYFSGSILANGRKYTEDDKTRLLGFLDVALTDRSVSGSNEGPTDVPREDSKFKYNWLYLLDHLEASKLSSNACVGKLRDMIQLSADFVAPEETETKGKKNKFNFSGVN